jgi:hypothetical protein
MYVHKTAVNAPAGKPDPAASMPAAKNVQSKIPQTQAAKSSASASAPAPPLPAVPRSVSAMIAAAGLPADKLSASIISFARFFSLPIKPELMASIRRQAFAPQSQAAQPENAPEPGPAAKGRETLSLAAAAAEGKGVELHPKGLEAFAEAIDPDWQKRQEGEGRQRGRRNKNGEREEEKAPSKTAPVTASAVEEMALGSAQNDPLLAVMNKLPGKNGQRWIVLPFSFSENGREFRVSLRILLETGQAANSAACMALDVAEYGAEYGGAESSSSLRRWLFVIEAANGSAKKLSANSLTVHIQPDLPQKALAQISRELANLLEIPQERVFVKNRTESFPCESGRADQLRSVDEAV